jgi:hypothetical protein
LNSPRIYSPQGEYLGNLNRNQFDPNSVSNQFGGNSPRATRNAILGLLRGREVAPAPG